MKLLIAGDSITEGITGISYIEKLEERYPALEITNLGLGGDTLIGISNRVLEHLKKQSDYDAVIIEAGHNDILLPFFEHGEMPFKITAKSLEARGSVPITDGDIFLNQYDTLLKLLPQVTNAPIFITTLSCIGERLSRFTNLKRHHYNEIITSLADKYGVVLIDIASVFDHYLQMCMTNDYLMNDFFRAFVIDSKVIKSHQYLNDLSAERGLNLTIDGVHLNDTGSDLYTDTIAKSLQDQGLI
ncbi:SGNH/GDSL hydrolase family protein [Fusibacter paucivorans]|uniref:SGNH/GDSL hydrolase family protein n=1 Tax=Fusibacter paucivorans TaxID=76009 RepID=A0ABS5PT44_9FIRM|nr:SGNH/GDSL hydrolase family protein [Fusibacter paucivorans]MBS7528251.1 SGNH/GDSL hydrolase family protein [Fusibacter paucivorans]